MRCNGDESSDLWGEMRQATNEESREDSASIRRKTWPVAFSHADT